MSRALKEPHPKGPFSIGMIGDVPRVLDAKGRDVMRLTGGMERLVECANAIRHDVWFPVAHVAGLERDVVRLEQLRKDALALSPAPQEAAE
jgi:hypothetical protein